MEIRFRTDANGYTFAICDVIECVGGGSDEIVAMENLLFCMRSTVACAKSGKNRLADEIAQKIASDVNKWVADGKPDLGI